MYCTFKELFRYSFVFLRPTEESFEPSTETFRRPRLSLGGYQQISEKKDSFKESSKQGFKNKPR